MILKQLEFEASGSTVTHIIPEGKYWYVTSVRGNNNRLDIRTPDGYEMFSNITNAGDLGYFVSGTVFRVTSSATIVVTYFEFDNE